MSEETTKLEQAQEEATSQTEEIKDETSLTSSKTGSDNAEVVEIPEKFKSLVEEIEKMSVLDLAELVKILEKKFGVSAAAPVAMVANSATGGEEGGDKEDKSVFNVELTSVGDNKIGVIKAIRELTQVGLKDAKDIADSAPKIIKENVTKEEAQEMKKKIEEVGGSVELK